MSEIVSKELNPHKIVSKAVDESGNTQPESIESIWNIRGLCNNSWYWKDIVENKENTYDP